MEEYRELVFEGSLPVVRAFLTGVGLARGWTTPFLCFDDHGIRGESRGHRALEKIGLTADLTYVAVTDSQASVILEMARAAEERLGIAVRGDRVVRGAEFSFEFRLFDRAIAGRLRTLLAAPGGDVTVVLTDEGEELHPEGRGIEAYAPEHDYIFEGRGVARGALRAVVALREQLRQFEQVECEKIRLS